MDTKLHEKYSELVRLIQEYGTPKPKKHGFWIRCKYIDNNYFCLDSWNHRISLIQDAEYDNLHTGFIGNIIISSMGIDFGSFECHVKEEQFNC